MVGERRLVNDIITPVSKGGLASKMRAFIDKKRNEKSGIVTANPFTVDIQREVDRFNRRQEKERSERIVR